MKKAWKAFKSIAHLTLPFYKMWAEPDAKLNINFYTQEGANNFIVMAGNLQASLLSLSPQHGHKNSIIEPEELWLVPSYFSPIQKVPINMEPLSEQQKSILDAYTYGD